MAKFLKVYQLFIILLALLGCNTSQKKMEEQKFDWQPTVCAPKAFPIRLISASLRLADSVTTDIQPKSLIANGWGEIGAVSIIGDNKKALPVELNIRWFSYVERKCYGGSFILDKSTLLSLFQSGLASPSSDSKAGYTHLIIGAAPLGGLSVWLSGEGITNEVAHFSAKEAEVNMKQLIGTYPNADAFARDVINQNLPKDQVLMQGATQQDLEKWSGLYRRNFKWYWSVIATAKPGGLLTHFFNGESAYWPQTPDSSLHLNRPLPKDVSVRWEQTGGSGYATTLHFDEKELFAAFEKLAGTPGPLGIQLEINQINGEGKAFVVNQTNVISLSKK